MELNEKERCKLLAQFLSDRYEEERAAVLKRSNIRISQNDFARRIGLNEQSLSQYINAKRLPDGKNRDILIMRYGEAILEIIGYDPDRAEIDELIADYGAMDDEQRKLFMTQLRAKRLEAEQGNANQTA